MVLNAYGKSNAPVVFITVVEASEKVLFGMVPMLVPLVTKATFV